MENLPVDILSNIFTRLLAKQVAQMRCVSKYWNALLYESSFIKSHLHHSIHNNDRVLLVFSFGVSSPSDPELCTAYLRRSPHTELTNFIKLPPVNPKSGHTPNLIKVIGSVHGLICFSYCDDVVHIWNPSLSAVLTLPPHSKTPGSRYEIRFRFGYDPNTEDYKVVKLIGICRSPRFISPLSYFIAKWLPVEIYSMRKGSWEFITQRFPSHITSIVRDYGICVNEPEGHLHWIGYIDDEKNLQTIVAFDLGSETFREMLLPDSVFDDKEKNVLGVLGGKLCVMSEDWPCGLEIWVMDEYGVAESWVKRHVISHACYSPRSFGVTPHNEFLTEDYHNLNLYAPVTENAEFLDYISDRRYFADKVVEYVDSLVWIAPDKLIARRMRKPKTKRPKLLSHTSRPKLQQNGSV